LSGGQSSVAGGRASAHWNPARELRVASVQRPSSSADRWPLRGPLTARAARTSAAIDQPRGRLMGSRGPRRLASQASSERRPSHWPAGGPGAVLKAATRWPTGGGLRPSCGRHRVWGRARRLGPEFCSVEGAASGQRRQLVDGERAAHKEALFVRCQTVCEAALCATQWQQQVAGASERQVARVHCALCRAQRTRANGRAASATIVCTRLIYCCPSGGQLWAALSLWA